MTRLAVAMIELQAAVAKSLTQAWKDHADLRMVAAEGALDELARNPPDLIIVPERLSKRSGFGLVNRIRHMEALDAAKLILVSIRGTQDALDHHQAGPTPADAYVLRPKVGGYTALAHLVMGAAAKLYPGRLTTAESDLEEVDAADVEEVDPDPAPDDLDARLQGVMERLGGYRVLRRIRDEDGGAVFACMDEELDRPVAVKILPPPGPDDGEAVQRFLRERQVLAVVNSPHVLRVHGAGTHEGCPYLVRELVVGASLDSLLLEGAPAVDDILRWGREAALALKHTFDAGVVHRDVRPANIYIVDGHVKLARFGAGRVLRAREHEITMPDARMRHQAYCAPERVGGGGDDRSDIYSLGATLHTLLTGRAPFASARPIDVVTHKRKEDPLPLVRDGEPVRPDIAALVTRMMAEDVADRPQSWNEVIVALDNLRHPASAAPAPVETLEPEPSGIHGTLRRMNVIDLVQSLELSRKTAVVTVSAPDGAEGLLAFDAGELTFARWRAETGEEAFFALAALTDGAFRVGFGAPPDGRNVHQPTMGLLLEAVRRRDEDDAGALPEGASGPGVTDSGWFAAAPGEDAGDAGPGDVLFAIDEEHQPRDDDAPDAARGVRSGGGRRVPSAVGYLAIAAGLGLGGWGGLQLPSWTPAPAEEGAQIDKLVDEQYAKLRRLRQELQAAGPAVAAAADKAAQAARAEAAGAQVRAQLEELLATDVKARRVRLRTADDKLVLEISSDILFGGVTAQLTPDGQALVSRVSTALAAAGVKHVGLEAHSDDRAPPPAAGHANNWGLNGAQGQAMVGALGVLGWTADQLTFVARADTAPLQSNAGPRGRARNRRIDVVMSWGTGPEGR